MHKWNLLKKTAPCILSLAVAATSFPTAVMATDLDSSIVADETEQSDEEEIAEVSDYEAAAGEAADAEEIAAEDQSADEITEESAAENTEEEASGADEFTAAEDETEAFADSDELQGEYQYVYAGLTWAEYWASEGVYAAGDTTSSEELDVHKELDKGAFDTVTRATTNHGLHRGSFQTETTIVAEDGSRYPIATWVDQNTIKLTDGKTVGFKKGTITKADGTTVDMDHYEVYGLKYVPVAVRTEDYAAFCQKYNVVTNDGVLEGGYGEVQLSAYTATAAVTADTNGLKYAVKNGDSFTFEARKTGADSGIKDQAQKTATNVTPTVKDASGSYGEFLRVDVTGDGYGDLGANMQAVRWDYCGDDATGTKVLASYGTKFAADNWMHKTNGIQLGLTNSLRCQLPEGTDGTGYWRLTVYALGYADYSFVVQATDANIVKPAENPADTTALTKEVETAKALAENDYTKESWTVMQTELQEAEELLAREDATQAEVDEALEHLKAAEAALVKVTVTLDKTSATVYTGKTASLKTTSNDAAKTVTYTTSNNAVATVSSTGVVKGVKAGTAVITATCGNAKATCKVTVKTSTIKFAASAASVYTGKTVTVKATATPSATVTYTTSNKAIATVSSTGVVKGIKAGTVTITATTSTGLKTTCKVTVKAPSVKFAKSSAVVYTGKTATVKATLAGVSSVTYKSSNTKIATVNSKTGTVKGIKAGTVTITATSGKLKATYKLTVKNPTFTLTKSSATIAKGKTTTIRSKATPVSTVTYTSSNKKVATVTGKGVVKGISKGKATITVKCNGITKKFVVTVK